MRHIGVKTHLHLAGNNAFGIVGGDLGRATKAGYLAEDVVERNGCIGEAHHGRGKAETGQGGAVVAPGDGSGAMRDIGHYIARSNRAGPILTMVSV